MSGRTVLSPHVGHRAVVVSATQVRCLDCSWLLDWPKSSPVGQPTPTPPRFRLTGTGVAASSVPEWVELKKRMGRKP